VRADAYMPMLQTAEVVGQRYGISREACDEYAVQSQARTAAAQEAGRFDREIFAVTRNMGVADKETGAISIKEITLTKDEGNRPGTTLESLRASSRCSMAASSRPATPASFRTARPRWCLWRRNWQRGP
jgi:acetyl-CoA C-acetyltransferase